MNKLKQILKSLSNSKIFNLWILVLLGSVFLVAGITKINHTGEFTDILYHQYKLGYFSLFSPAIIISEIFIGLQLILQVRVRISLLTAFLFITVFTGVYIWGLSHGITNCYCFPDLKIFEANSWITVLLRNTIIGFLIILAYRLAKRRQESKIEGYQKAIILIVLLVGTFATGTTFHLPENFTTSRKENFDADLINSLKKESFYKSCENGRALLFFFSYNCVYCLNSIENVKKYIEDDIVDKVVFVVREGDNNTKQKFKDIFNIESEIFELTKNDILRYSRELPTTYYIRNDSIKFCHTGFVPVPQLLASKFPLIIKF